MTEHLLYGPQVGAVLHQLGGETVAQRVRTHLLLDAGGSDGVTQHDEHHLAREVMPTAVQKDILILTGLHLQVAAHVVYV